MTRPVLPLVVCSTDIDINSDIIVTVFDASGDYWTCRPGPFDLYDDDCVYQSLSLGPSPLA